MDASQIHLIAIIVDVTLVFISTTGIIPSFFSIIPALCSQPEYPYYAADYAGIMDATLSEAPNLHG